jgi:putative hemolysin
LIHIYLVIIPILLLIAALFAASEAALFSLSRPQLEALRQSRPGVFRKIRSFLQRPDELLSTLIVGNETLNILIGTLMVSVMKVYFSQMDEKLLGTLSVILSSVLMLVFSEVLPKVVAFRLPSLTAFLLIHPISFCYQILTPFRIVFLAVSREILKRFKVPVLAPAAISESEFKTLVELGEETGSLDKDEKQMIYNVFDFSDRSVASVMTPWKDVFTYETNISVEELLNRVRQKTFSRIPAISPKDGHVTGILYTKELLKFLLHPELVQEQDALNRAIFPPYIVSTHKKISTLFREFKLKKVHMALVVDEYGKNLGVVTLEDLLNALFQTQKKSAAMEEVRL